MAWLFIQWKEQDNRKNSEGERWRWQGIVGGRGVDKIWDFSWLFPHPILVNISHPPIPVIFNKSHPPLWTGRGVHIMCKLWKQHHMLIKEIFIQKGNNDEKFIDKILIIKHQ